MELNPTQQKAVDITDNNVLVFASAGGGKTTVLVSRLLKRIAQDRLSIDEIAAMTFTNAAALNMKKRLEKKLREKIKENPDDLFLKEQLSKIADANISTIHSFCLNIIKEYYYIIGLPKTMANNVLDDGTKQIYLRQAIEETLANDKRLLMLMTSLSSSLFSFDSLITIITSIINKARSQSDIETWFDKVRPTKIKSFEEIDAEVRKYYLDDIKGQLILAKTIINKIIALNTSLNPGYQRVLEIIHEIEDEDDYSYFLNRMIEILIPLPNLKDDDLYKKYRAELKDVYEKIASKLEPERQIINNYNGAIAIENALLDLSRDAYKRFQAIKFEHECMDFDDFEHFAKDILTFDNENIANKLKKQFKEIMVDEFQDTNDAQFSLIRLISNNNLFIVGDVKQSIYRFRKAKPAIMKSLKDDDTFIKIHIQNNYRSNTNIVNFNNELFNKIMNIYREDVDETDMQITLDLQAENNEEIEFKIINSDGDLAKSKAKLLANTIYELHEKGKAFKNIAVLVRTHDQKRLIKEALKAYNIPFFLTDNEGYFSSLSIDILISYFKLLLNKKDKFSIVSVLSSPLYNLSDKDLYMLRNDYFAYEDFKNDYYYLLKLSKQNKVDEIINYILTINDFYFEHLNTQEKANIDYLLNNLDNYKIYNVADFINYIESTEDYQSENASTVSEDANVVKVMTIHNSKGLEFDNVILYSTHQNLFNESKESVCIDDNWGLGINYIKSPIGYTISTIKKKAYLAKENIEDILEFQRLLYVALTRAKSKLIIIDSLSANEEIDDYKYPLDLSLFYARKGFTSYICSSMSENKDFKYYSCAALEDKKPLEAECLSKRNIPFKEYNSSIKKDLSPSALESFRKELHLGNNEAMQYGTKIHQIFEDIDYSEAISQEILKTKYPDISDYTINSILFFVDSPLIQEAKKGHIYKELPFYIKDKDTLLHGYMDFVAVLEDKIILIDYKTDSGIDKEEFIMRYKAQIKSYTDALKRIYDKEVNAYIYAISKSEFISF